MAHIQQAFLEHVARPLMELSLHAAPWAIHSSEAGNGMCQLYRAQEKKGTAKIMICFKCRGKYAYRGSTEEFFERSFIGRSNPKYDRY